MRRAGALTASVKWPFPYPNSTPKPTLAVASANHVSFPCLRLPAVDTWRFKHLNRRLVERCTERYTERSFFSRQYANRKATSSRSDEMTAFGKRLTSLKRRRLKIEVCFVLLFVFPVFVDAGEEKPLLAMEGDDVTLSAERKPNETMRYYFNGALIALINGNPGKSCLYDGEGSIFRGRLKVDYETGPLIVTNITTNHTGRYEAELIRANSTGTRLTLNRTAKCDGTKIIKANKSGNIIKTFDLKVNGKPPKASDLPVVGIVCIVLLVAVAVAGGVIYFCLRRSRNGRGTPVEFCKLRKAQHCEVHRDLTVSPVCDLKKMVGLRISKTVGGEPFGVLY